MSISKLKRELKKPAVKNAESKFGQLANNLDLDYSGELLFKYGGTLNPQRVDEIYERAEEILKESNSWYVPFFLKDIDGALRFIAEQANQGEHIREGNAKDMFGESFLNLALELYPDAKAGKIYADGGEVAAPKQAHYMTQDEYLKEAVPVLKDYKAFLRKNKYFTSVDYGGMNRISYPELKELMEKRGKINFYWDFSKAFPYSTPEKELESDWASQAAKNLLEKDASPALIAKKNEFQEKLKSLYGEKYFEQILSEQDNTKSNKRAIRYAIDYGIYEKDLKSGTADIKHLEAVAASAGVKLPKKLYDEKVIKNEAKQKEVNDVLSKIPPVNRAVMEGLIKTIETEIKPFENMIYEREDDRYRKLIAEIKEMPSITEDKISGMVDFYHKIFVFAKTEDKRKTVVKVSRTGYKSRGTVHYKEFSGISLIPNWEKNLETEIRNYILMLRLTLTSTIIQNFNRITKPIKSIQNLEIRKGAKGFQGEFRFEFEDGSSLLFKTEAIEAGGYNIQRFHYRYISDFLQAKTATGEVFANPSYSTIVTYFSDAEELKQLTNPYLKLEKADTLEKVRDVIYDYCKAGFSFEQVRKNESKADYSVTFKTRTYSKGRRYNHGIYFDKDKDLAEAKRRATVLLDENNAPKPGGGDGEKMKEGGFVTKDPKVEIINADDNDIVNVYHATAEKFHVDKNGLKASGTQSKNFNYSESGYVHAAVYPEAAFGYAKFSFPNEPIIVYKLSVPKKDLLPDSKAIKAYKHFNPDAKNTLKDSVNYYGLVRIARNINPDEISIANVFQKGGKMQQPFLAPNGNPSNLTKEQWNLVRTPAFKTWFGDWESLSANLFLKEENNIIEVTQLFNLHDLKEKKERNKYIKSVIDKVHSEIPFIRGIKIAKTGLKHSLSHASKPEVLNAIFHLKELLEESMLFKIERNHDLQDTSTEYFWYYVNKILYNHIEYAIVFVIRKTVNSEEFLLHDYNLEEIKKPTANTVSASKANPNHCGHDKSNQLSGTYNINSAKNTEKPIVNTLNASEADTNHYEQYRNTHLNDIFNTNPAEISKVIDENGEPLVVYHGSRWGGITEFGTGNYGAIYTSADYKYAKEYADFEQSVIYELFANIKSPVYHAAKYMGYGAIEHHNRMIAFYRHLYEINGRNNLIEAGFDGVIVDYAGKKFFEVVVLHPSGVKLADGTNTTFNPDENNIGFAPGGTIKDLGHTGKQIKFAGNNPAQTYVGVTNWLQKEGIKYDFDKARFTNSRYIKFPIGEIDFEIRISDHTKAHYGDPESKPVELSFLSTVLIDTSSGIKAKDVIEIIESYVEYYKVFEEKKISDLLEKEMIENFDEYITLPETEKYSRLLAFTGLEDDPHHLADAMIHSVYDGLHYKDIYQNKLREYKLKEELKNQIDIETYQATNGIIINTKKTNKSLQWEYDYNHLTDMTGKSNRRLRNEMIAAAKNELMVKLGIPNPDHRFLSYEDGGEIKGGNYSFNNEFGSFTSVKVMMVDENLRSSRDKFTVQVMVRGKQKDSELKVIKPKSLKTFPIEKYDSFIADLKARGAREI